MLGTMCSLSWPALAQSAEMGDAEPPVITGTGLPSSSHEDIIILAHYLNLLFPSPHLLAAAAEGRGWLGCEGTGPRTSSHMGIWPHAGPAGHGQRAGCCPQGVLAGDKDIQQSAPGTCSPQQLSLDLRPAVLAGLGMTPAVMRSEGGGSRGLCWPAWSEAGGSFLHGQPAHGRGGHHKSPTLSPGKGALEAGPHACPGPFQALPKGVAEKADTSRSCKPGLRGWPVLQPKQARCAPGCEAVGLVGGGTGRRVRAECRPQPPPAPPPPPWGRQCAPAPGGPAGALPAPAPLPPTRPCVWVWMGAAAPAPDGRSDQSAYWASADEPLLSVPPVDPGRPAGAHSQPGGHGESTVHHVGCPLQLRKHCNPAVPCTRMPWSLEGARSMGDTLKVDQMEG